MTAPVFRSANTATLLNADPGTINAPAGVADGDALLLLVTITANTRTLTTPSGWTLLEGPTDAGGGDCRSWLYGKVAASEPASYSLDFDGLSSGVAAVACWSGAAAAPFEDTSATTSNEVTSHPSANVTTTGADRRLVYLAGMDAETGGVGDQWTAPTGMTERVDTVGTAASYATIADKAEASAGTYSYTATSVEVDSATVFLVALAPAGGGSPVTITVDAGSSTATGGTTPLAAAQTETAGQATGATTAPTLAASLTETAGQSIGTGGTATGAGGATIAAGQAGGDGGDAVLAATATPTAGDATGDGGVLTLIGGPVVLGAGQAGATGGDAVLTASAGVEAGQATGDGAASSFASNQIAAGEAVGSGGIVLPSSLVTIAGGDASGVGGVVVAASLVSLAGGVATGDGGAPSLAALLSIAAGLAQANGGVVVVLIPIRGQLRARPRILPLLTTHPRVLPTLTTRVVVLPVLRARAKVIFMDGFEGETIRIVAGDLAKLDAASVYQAVTSGADITVTLIAPDGTESDAGTVTNTDDDWYVDVNRPATPGQYGVKIEAVVGGAVTGRWRTDMTVKAW